MATPRRERTNEPEYPDPWYAEQVIFDQQRAEEDAAVLLWLTNGEPPKAFVRTFLPVGRRATRDDWRHAKNCALWWTRIGGQAAQNAWGSVGVEPDNPFLAASLHHVGLTPKQAGQRRPSPRDGGEVLTAVEIARRYRILPKVLREVLTEAGFLE